MRPGTSLVVFRKKLRLPSSLKMVAAGLSEPYVNKPTFGLTRPLQSPFSETRSLHFDRCYVFADLGEINN